MTPQEKQDFAMLIAEAIAVKQDKDPWLDGQKHYDDHIKFCGWIKFFEKCKEDCSSFLRKLIIVAGIGLLTAGIYFAATLNT